MLDPLDKGIISWDKIITLGEIVSGIVPVNHKPNEIVYYKNSTGMGIQMAAAGALIYQNAKKMGLGKEIPTEWFGSDLTDWYTKGFFPSA